MLTALRQRPCEQPFPLRLHPYCEQVKVPVTVSMRPLREALDAPGEFLVSDFAKFDRPGLLHAAFKGLHAWRAKHGGSALSCALSRPLALSPAYCLTPSCLELSLLSHALSP